MRAGAFDHREEALEPELPVVDPHHHLWDDLTNPLATEYPLPQLITDLAGGHRVVASVYAECTSHWRSTGPAEFRPVGETEWVASLEVPAGVMAGIIGYADLRGGRSVRPVLEAHREAGGRRFSGIRHSTSWDPHPDVPNTAREVPPRTLTTPGFIEGVRLLGELDMTFDAWMYFHQLADVVALANHAPDTTIVLDHLGGPIAIGPYASARADMVASWRTHLQEVARRPNVVLKVGGLGFPYFLTEAVATRLRGSDELAEFWRPEVEFAIEAFGPERCMFESDFPVDAHATDYVTLWNAFKKLSAGYSDTERRALLSGTASRTYQLDLETRSWMWRARN